MDGWPLDELNVHHVDPNNRYYRYTKGPIVLFHIIEPN